MKKATGSIIATTTLVALAATAPVTAAGRSGADWSQWGGPSRDFVVAADGVGLEWDQTGPLVLWRRPLGPGYSGIVSLDVRLFTMTRRGDEEVVVALDRGSGETVWEHAYRAPVVSGPGLDVSWGSGPNSTPLVAAGRIYTLGFTGILSCLDAATGEPLWRHDLAAEFGVRVPFFGHSASPIRHGELLIVIAGGAFAFRLDSGERVWETREFTGSYASPALFREAEPPQLVVPAAGEVVSLDPRDGRLLWRHEHANEPRTILSGAVFGADRLLFASAYFLGSIGLELAADGGSVTELWETPRLQLSYCNSIRVGDLLFGFHNSILTALDVRTGEIVWRTRDFDRGNFLKVGERFLLLDRRGKLSLVSMGPGGATAHAEAQILEGRSWTAPTLVGSRLYARNLESIVAVDLSRSAGSMPLRQARATRPAVTAPTEFLAARARLMAAYRAGDAEAMVAAAGGLGRWTDDPVIGNLAVYYRGFASYQQALLSEDGALPHLRRAEELLVEATRRDPTFAEAHALLARIYPMYYRFDPRRAWIVGPLGDEHLASAVRFEPDNPRVMAIQGLDFVYSPPEHGGDPEAGLELLRRALDRFAELADAPPTAWPSWGHASAWAWYGRALLRQEPPDREGAFAAFRRALELAPDLVQARRLVDDASARD